VKLATGILLFEWGSVGVLGPMQAEAERSAGAVLGLVDPATLAGRLAAERNSLGAARGRDRERRARHLAARLTRLPD
jgi:hypothetical protein